MYGKGHSVARWCETIQYVEYIHASKVLNKNQSAAIHILHAFCLYTEELCIECNAIINTSSKDVPYFFVCSLRCWKIFDGQGLDVLKKFFDNFFLCAIHHNGTSRTCGKKNCIIYMYIYKYILEASGRRPLNIDNKIVTILNNNKSPSSTITTV